MPKSLGKSRWVESSFDLVNAILGNALGVLYMVTRVLSARMVVRRSWLGLDIASHNGDDIPKDQMALTALSSPEEREEVKAWQVLG